MVFQEYITKSLEKAKTGSQYFIYKKVLLSLKATHPRSFSINY
jgi:hypothetical protein